MIHEPELVSEVEVLMVSYQNVNMYKRQNQIDSEGNKTNTHSRLL